MSSGSWGTNEDLGQLWWLQLWLMCCCQWCYTGLCMVWGTWEGRVSGTDGELTPQKGRVWKAEWPDASPEHSQLMEHIWEHMGSLWKGESDWALSLPNCFDFSS